jgi:hypothetical protein
LLHPPPQSSFSGRSPLASQQALSSVFTSFLQQSASFAQEKAGVIGIAMKAKTNKNGIDMAVTMRITNTEQQK